jgi:phosphoglycolate phosphatase
MHGLRASDHDSQKAGRKEYETGQEALIGMSGTPLRGITGRIRHMNYILMDLDGTITNPKLGITKSLQYALRHWDIIVEDLDTLTKHIGPPLKGTFIEHYGFSEEKANEAIKKYREYFEVKGLYENEPYEGIEELLANLKRAGKKIIVATSKPELMARKILEHFKLAEYFEDICGATYDDSRSEKEDVIRYAMEKNHITDNSEVVMVGDRKYDVFGAKTVGIASIGVLYGFGDREELEKAGADRIAANVEDVYDVIINFK